MCKKAESICGSITWYEQSEEADDDLEFNVNKFYHLVHHNADNPQHFFHCI